MTEHTAAIIARFSPAEWARSKALGFPIPTHAREKLKPASRRWTEARRMAEARKRIGAKAA